MGVLMDLEMTESAFDAWGFLYVFNTSEEDTHNWTAGSRKGRTVGMD